MQKEKTMSTKIIAQHTPGPWTRDHLGFIFDAEGHVLGRTFEDVGESEEANGFMFAAAPALLVALEELIAELPDSELDLAIDVMSYTNVQCIKRRKQQAKEAIAKARGVQQ